MSSALISHSPWRKRTLTLAVAMLALSPGLPGGRPGGGSVWVSSLILCLSVLNSDLMCVHVLQFVCSSSDVWDKSGLLMHILPNPKFFFSPASCCCCCQEHETHHFLFTGDFSCDGATIHSKLSWRGWTVFYERFIKPSASTGTLSLIVDISFKKLWAAFIWPVVGFSLVPTMWHRM